MSSSSVTRDSMPAELARPLSIPIATIGAVLAACALLWAGVQGVLSAAWGYALFVVAGVAFCGGLLATCMLMLTRRGSAGQLAAWAGHMSKLGAVAYVLAVAALAGHYAHETLQGRMELRWIVFGPLVLVALVSFEWGIYRKLVKANAVTWQRYRRFIDRDQADPKAMRQVLVDDVIAHRSLWRTSKLRWLRHTLIFWGFAGMFAVELAAAFVREAVPAFGWPDVWRVPGHPVRSSFDLAYDLTGVMMLLGCVLALYWRFTVRGKPERKYADTPMVWFLAFVVVSGFVVEGWRLAQNPDQTANVFSFAGVWFAAAMAAAGATSPNLNQPLWLIHVVASCALIAYVPATRLIHTCATPLGRLMNSQKGLLSAKKHGVLAGLWRQAPGTASEIPPPGATFGHPTPD